MKQIFKFKYKFISIVFFAYASHACGQVISEMEKDCRDDTAVKQYLCLSDKFEIIDKKLSEEVEGVIKSFRSLEGLEADIEVKNRMQSAQTAWTTYRDKQCTLHYYSKAKSHSPSDDLASISCKISKTKERLNELRPQ